MMLAALAALVRKTSSLFKFQLNLPNLAVQLFLYFYYLIQFITSSVYGKISVSHPLAALPLPGSSHEPRSRDEHPAYSSYFLCFLKAFYLIRRCNNCIRTGSDGFPIWPTSFLRRRHSFYYPRRIRHTQTIIIASPCS